jgi:hypothetical protein
MDLPQIEPEELARLREFSADLSRTQLSPWEPRVVARAFARPARSRCRFTLQVWVDLDHGLSPLLMGRLPTEIAELDDAIDAFGLGIVELTAQEAVDLGMEMLEAIAAGFAMMLKMRPPQGFTTVAADDGFGAWLPLLAALVKEAGLTVAEARSLPVGEAYALLAACRRQAGWETAGPPYSMRELGEATENETKTAAESPAPEE